MIFMSWNHNTTKFRGHMSLDLRTRRREEGIEPQGKRYIIILGCSFTFKDLLIHFGQNISVQNPSCAWMIWSLTRCPYIENLPFIGNSPFSVGEWRINFSLYPCIFLWTGSVKVQPVQVVQLNWHEHTEIWLFHFVDTYRSCDSISDQPRPSRTYHALFISLLEDPYTKYKEAIQHHHPDSFKRSI